MENQKITEFAPLQWQALKTTLEGQCAGIRRSSPVQLAIGHDGENEMSVTNLRSRKAVLFRFEPEGPSIHVEIGRKSGVLGFRLAADGSCVQLMDGIFPRSTTEVSVNLIRRIL